MPISPRTKHNIYHLEAIPPELRSLPRWVCWQSVPDPKGGKPGKPPKNPHTGGNAMCNNPATWGTFEQALAALPGFDGLSFVLNGDGVVGIDLDKCRNVGDGSIGEWAGEVIKRFNSYTEISPSGTGIRIFLRGQLPPDGRHKGDVEVYADNKFLTVTGNKITSYGAGDGIEDRADELLAWHGEVFGTRPTRETDGGGLILNDAPTIDPLRLEQLFQARPKARELFNGERNGYPSQSEADMALANYASAAGWAGQELCDLLVVARSNGNADKNKPLDYYARTIDKACEGTAQQIESEQGKPVSEGVARAPLVTIEEARTIYCRHLHLPKPDVVDVVLGVVAGNKLLDTDPLWLFLKGPPGSGKTELLSPIKDRTETEFVSSLTSAALISGYGDLTNKDEPWSLLPKLNGKCLVIKDFTLVLSMNPKHRDEIFGILRDAYDGYSSKAFGTGQRGYASKFNLLSGVTNAIEKAWQLSNLGERFLCWGMEVDRKAQARRAMTQENEQMKKELAAAAAGVLDHVGDVVPGVSDEIAERTLLLADLLARLRTYVDRDRNDVVHRAPDVEVPTRLVKQLLRLGKSVALVRRKKEITEPEFRLMLKVATDSIPSARHAMFGALVQCRGAQTTGTVEYFAKTCRISHSPARRHLDDMTLLGLVETETKEEKLHYRLTDEVWQEWHGVWGQVADMSRCVDPPPVPQRESIDV